MEALIRAFAQDEDVQSIISGIRSGMREQMVSGLSGSSRQMMFAAMSQELKQPILVVAHNMFAAQKIAEDMQGCLPKDQVLLYPANELMSVEAASASPEMMAGRLHTLTRLSQGFQGVVVAPFAAVRRFLPVQEVFSKASKTISTGDKLDLEAFLNQMVEMGYTRVERVESKGELSVRGGIIDFYPMITEEAVRIELFDDEIDSIRTFEVDSQRSVEPLESVDIIPCRELIAGKARFENAAQHLYDLLQSQLAKMTDHKAKERLLEEIGEDIERLKAQQYFNGIQKYISLIYPERKTLLDYLPSDTILAVDEPIRLIETGKQLEREEGEWVTSLLEEGKFLPSLVMSENYESLLLKSRFPVVYVSLFLRQVPQTQPQNIVNIVCRAMQNFHGQMNLLKSEMERWLKAGNHIFIVADGEERMDKVRRVLEDYQIPAPKILSGRLQGGYELSAIRQVVVTESEMFSSKQRKVRKNDKRLENAERIKSYRELKVGDYVVHVNHGIGKYVGIGTLEINGIHKDYLHIVYAGGDKLSVPIDQIDLIQKYVGAEDKEPKVYKLGGTEWTKVKKKVRSSVQDIADDLIKLYAERQAFNGHAFNKDTPYQQTFEDQFMYEETPDQLRAIEEIKRDMEKTVPMDRLLCGDVGYGKTEVAVRAAFKAAMEGLQVAVLVPTTILAQQHYETFKERFSEYPFQIEVLSRFRSRKEQNETNKKVKAGTVDILIGTHRLLSKDVQFKQLGLLIVDEEQRFGVSHKEKLKQLKTNVDVLTLTATPIPRTLHMSMLGVRDLSVIETPPENRFPVQTYVVEHSTVLMREAIERELARGGQVYYLFNRVQGIHQMADQISALVPEARVAIGHGKMAEQELERTILDFLDGEYDVLVSTSIIETGVDIPNVNTLIVHDADKMGLSQLYQLRGRVGRSNRIAYAYFTYQRDKVLTEVAEKRLQSIKEFTELGSGFKIAMRDLSLRGAGNLLGTEQHGFIASVGFDMYSQMLAEEIEKRKQGISKEEEVQAVETTIDLPIDAYIPSDYIYDSIQKIEIYKKVANIESLEEADDVFDEVLDRFGDLPQAVTNLLAIARLKVYGQRYGIASISMNKDKLQVKMDEKGNERIDGKKLVQVCSKFKDRVKVIPDAQIMIEFRGKGLSAEQAVDLLEQFLIQYNNAVNMKGELQDAAK